MSAFEFLFSFYGLLLGLALTEVIGGASRAINDRPRRPIGWLTPMLAVVLALDLMTFWAGAWRDMREWEFTGQLLLAAALSPMIYYFSAKQAFPDSNTEVASLDEHFFQHRGWVLGGVVLANQIAYLPDFLIEPSPQLVGRFLLNLAFVAPFAVAAIVNVRWIIGLIFMCEIGWLLWLLVVRM